MALDFSFRYLFFSEDQVFLPKAGREKQQKCFHEATGTFLADVILIVTSSTSCLVRQGGSRPSGRDQAPPPPAV